MRIKLRLAKKAILIYSMFILAAMMLGFYALISPTGIQAASAGPCSGQCNSGQECNQYGNPASGNMWACYQNPGAADYGCYQVPTNDGGNHCYLSCNNGWQACGCNVDQCQSDCLTEHAGQPGTYIHTMLCASCQQKFSCSCTVTTTPPVTTPPVTTPPVTTPPVGECPFNLPRFSVYYNINSDGTCPPGTDFNNAHTLCRTGLVQNISGLQVAGVTSFSFSVLADQNLNFIPNGQAILYKNNNQIYQQTGGVTHEINLNQINANAQFLLKYFNPNNINEECSRATAAFAPIVTTPPVTTPPVTTPPVTTPPVTTPPVTTPPVTTPPVSGLQVTKVAVNNSGRYGLGETVVYLVRITNTGQTTFTFLNFKDFYNKNYLTLQRIVNPANGQNLTGSFSVDTNIGLITQNNLVSLYGNLTPGRTIEIQFEFTTTQAIDTTCNDVFINPGNTDFQARACIRITVPIPTTDL